MKQTSEYTKGEAVEVAPQYVGSGRYIGGTTRTMYVVGPCGDRDLKLSYSPQGSWDLIVHLQAIVGSGFCFWEHEQKQALERARAWHDLHANDK